MIFPRRALSASPSAPGTGSSNPSPSSKESANFSVPERRTDRREDNVAVVSRNFLFCPRPPGCGYVSMGGGARCSQRLWAAEVGHRWWRQCPQQIGKLGRGNGAAPRAPRRMRCQSRQRVVQGSRPERRCAIDGRLALGVPSVHRRSSPRLVDGQCRQRGRRRRGLVRRFRAPEAWSAVPAFRGLCAATARDCTAALATGRFSTRTIFTTAAPARPRAMTAASNKAEPASKTRDLPLGGRIWSPGAGASRLSSAHRKRRGRINAMG